MAALSKPQQQELVGQVRIQCHGVTLQDILNDPQLANLPRDLDVVEIFTTVQSVVKAAQERLLQAAAYDILQGDPDVLTAPGFWCVVRLLLRLKENGLAAIAPCCSSFGFPPRRRTRRNAANVNGDLTYKGWSQGET